MQENELYQELLTTRDRVPLPHAEAPRAVTDYAHLVRNETWQQAWDAESRTVSQRHSITGRIWSDAIAQCLKENGAAFIPKMDAPVYIDRPIVLAGGQRLVVHPDTEIRLKPGPVGTCMVSNASIVFAQDRPVTMCAGADDGIVIEGGIWSDQNNEGRGRGGSFDEQG